MMMNQLTHNQATTLAAFINSIRGDWDTAGVIDALGKAREKAPGPDLAIAAIRASQLASNRTPAIIGLDGPHWRPETAVEQDRRPTPPKPSEACSTCGKRDDQAHPQDHPFVPLRLARQHRVPPPGDLVREAIYEANGECCACGVLAIHCPVHREVQESEPIKESA